MRAAQDFDAFYQARHTSAEAGPATGSILVLTVDGKGVVMRPEDLREATQKAAATRQRTFTARLGKGRRLHAKRTASVAAVYTVAPLVRTPEEIFPPESQPAPSPARPAPEHKRVWASLEHSPGEIITAMFEEAEHRDPRHQEQWVALVAGNETQIELLAKHTVARNVAMPIVLDFIHVAEYVWEASRAFAADHQARDGWVLPRLRDILRGKASDVAAGMRRSATLRGWAAEDRKPVDVCADYLLKYAPYLHYDEALRHGTPIATGVVEGACGHLVEDRMNLTGARWSLKGAEAVLRLRALRSSGDFDEYLTGPSIEGFIGGHEEIHLGAALWNRGNVMVGIYGQWHGHPSGDRRLLTMDLGLAISHDALHFHEPVPDFRIVASREQPESPKGVGPALMQGQGMENVGDQTLYWYSLWLRSSRGEGNGVRLVTWERDRLGMLKPYGPSEPQAISCPIRIAGGTARVFVNAGGLGQYTRLRVGLLDEGFHPMTGFSGEDDAVLAADGLKIPVCWKAGDGLGPSIGTFRLWIRFDGIRPEDGCLYAVYVEG